MKNLLIANRRKRAIIDRRLAEIREHFVESNAIESRVVHAALREAEHIVALARKGGPRP